MKEDEIKSDASQNINNDETNAAADIDLEKLRLGQNYAEIGGVKKKVLNINVKRPHKQQFFQTHPDESFRMTTYILEYKGEGESENYLIDPSLWEELSSEIVPKILFTVISRQGDISLWPIRMPGKDGRQDNWSRSALDGAHAAMKEWVRLNPNKAVGSYEVFIPQGELSGPEWPNITFQEILNIAFKDRYIRNVDHPILKKLRGESM
ncbi:MAG: hypothetical protein ACKVQC_05860 [Elusimicrobiota bacterium]